MVLDEAHANHDGAPTHGNGGEVYARAELADEYRGRGLEDDVRDEEDEVGNVLSDRLAHDLR